MSDKKVFITRDIPEPGLDMLRSAGFQIESWTAPVPMTPDELIARVKNCDALISTSAEKMNAGFLETCRHLEIISQYAAGYDNIDLAAATRLGIPVGNTPGAMSDAAADVAFGLMIVVARNMFQMHKTIAAGTWGYFQPKANLGIELRNRTLGVFGLGAIGLEMAKRCKGGYNMDILYCNRTPNAEAETLLQAKRVSFEELLAQSDVLSVHASLNADSKGIFNKSAFDRMKPGAIFINTSRGSLHEEQDLIGALQSGRIWGAGLDVTNPEPMRPDNPLLSMHNVAVLPHIGSATVEARNTMARMAAENIIEFYKGNAIPYPVL
jgi:glyoxylate reductase